MNPEPLIGRVNWTPDPHFVKVMCPDAPRHLRDLFISRWAARSAKVGDRVKLEYRKTGRGYEWVVAEVLV